MPTRARNRLSANTQYFVRQHVETRSVQEECDNHASDLAKKKALVRVCADDDPARGGRPGDPAIAKAVEVWMRHPTWSAPQAASEAGLKPTTSKEALYVNMRRQKNLLHDKVQMALAEQKRLQVAPRQHHASARLNGVVVRAPGGTWLNQHQMLRNPIYKLFPFNPYIHDGRSLCTA